MAFDLAAITRRVAPTRRKYADVAVIVPTKALEEALAAIYVRVVRLVAGRAQDRLLPAYRRGLTEVRDHIGDINEMVRDDIPEIQGEIDSLEAELQRLVLTLIPEMRSWAIRVEGWHRRKWLSGTLTATGVDLMTLVGPEGAEEALEAVLARNTALIKDLSAQAQGRVSEAVWRGFQERRPARDVAKSINEAVQMSRRRALNIAADQMQKLSAELDGARMREAGINTWVWRHSGKLHPRAEHKARDGNVYTDKTAPQDLPGQLPFCGCKKQARVVFE